MLDSLSETAGIGTAANHVPASQEGSKLRTVRFGKALGLLLLLFAGAYGPGFLAVALLKLQFSEAVPLIIVSSFGVAIKR